MTRITHSIVRTSAASLTCVLLLTAGSSSAEIKVTRQAADRLLEKLSLIHQYQMQPRKLPQRTPVSEGEVNAYLRYHARGQLPSGVTNPTVQIAGNGRLVGRATVDLDAVRRGSSGSWLDPASYLSGRMPVVATGVLHTRNGAGRFVLEKAEISGWPVPKMMLQELVSYYSRSPEYPRGVNLDAPFELPQRIREIQVGVGQAVVVQQ